MGAIFVGGVHDFASLVASVRHRASSIGELVKQHMAISVWLIIEAFNVLVKASLSTTT